MKNSKVLLDNLSLTLQNEVVLKALHKITLNSPNREILEEMAGQKARPTYAKKSIPGFKVRQNQIMGYSVSLRRKRMYNFVERFFGVTLPSDRSFRGFSHPKSEIEKMNSKSKSIGFKEASMFREKYAHIGFGLSVVFADGAGESVSLESLLPKTSQ